tara:strand:- start:250 stop:1608 length:1359 start_codon:yes stop_codon:yes gene_type:complete
MTMGRKIAVVGASMEGFIQLALLVNGRRWDGREEYPDDEYVLIHDSDKVYPYLLHGVGQSFHETLEREIYFTKNWLRKYCNGVDNCGYKYVGWGNRTDKNFLITGCGMSFDIEKFRQEFIKNGGDIFGPNVTIKEERIDSFDAGVGGCTINDVEYDYVIDCSQKNPLIFEDDYMTPSIEYTNSSIVIEKPIEGNFNTIIDYAAKCGHLMGIPLTNKQIWSYCYNDELNSKEEVEEDLASIFPDEDITKYKTYNHSWEPRVSNYVIHPDNKRYIRNGTALINIEPCLSQANYAEEMGTQICMYLYATSDRAREEHNHHMLLNYNNFILQTLQAFMAFSYQYGSRHEDSKFWDNAESKAVKYLESPIFTHPDVFPGKSFRNEILNEKFKDEDFRLAHHKQEGTDECVLPSYWMSNTNCFYEYVIGLGAPYAQYLKVMGDINPPEPHGVISYDCL